MRHMQAEAEKQPKKREYGETHVGTREGGRPPTWAVNPQMGEPRGNE